MQVLIRYNGNIMGQLNESQSVTIGRDIENDIVLESPKVSRRHARLTLKDGIVIVEDLGSTHGTWQGNSKIANTQFGTQCEINFGGANILFDFSQYQGKKSRPKNEGERIETAKFQTISGGYKLENPSFSSALNLALKTWPYMMTRLGILLAYSVGFVLWIAVWGKIVSMLGKSADSMGILWLLIFVAPLGIFQFFLRYSLYVLKAGHIACLTKLARGEQIPETGMVAYGKDIVTKHFVQVNILFAVDAIVRGITRQFNSTLDWLSSLIPIPGLQGIMSLVRSIITMATTFIDESILSYNLSRDSDDVWMSSRDALVLYAQNSKQMLIAAAWAVVFEWAMTAVLFLICLAPAGFLMTMAHQGMGIASLIVGLLFALNIRAAIVRPILLTFILLKFHNVIEGQQPDAIWKSNLERVSSKFKELGQKIGFGNQPKQTAV